MNSIPGTGLAASLPPASEAAVGYAADHHWDVVPGTSLVVGADGSVCSCGDLHCRFPGAHPVGAEGAAGVSNIPSRVRAWWEAHPNASVLLPTGRTLDVIEVSEPAGLLALARMERFGILAGAVAASPARRVLFFVAPGSTPRLPRRMRELGYAAERLDLACHGLGSFVAAPPTRIGALGPVRWLRSPETAGRWLPEAAELAAPLAYACAHHRPHGPRAVPVADTVGSGAGL